MRLAARGVFIGNYQWLINQLLLSLCFENISSENGKRSYQII